MKISRLEGANVQFRERLHQTVEDIQSVVTPFVEDIYQIQEKFKACLQQLNAVDPILRVGVFGPSGSGKSTLLNALCGRTLLPTNQSLHTDGDKAPETNAPVEVVHSPLPLLSLKHKRSGKHVAAGAEDIRECLKQENARWYEQKGRGDDLLDFRLEVPLCYLQDNTFAEVQVGLTEIPPGQTLIHSWRTGRKSSYHFVHTTVSCDAAVYVIDYPALRTPREADLFREFTDDLNPEAIRAMADSLFFVVTWLDPLLADVHQVHNVHDELTRVSLRFTSVEEVRTYTGDLIASRLRIRVRASQLAVCSGRHGLAARAVKARDPRPTIGQIYDFCELSYGSYYMQTIDDVDEGQLRERSRLHAASVEEDSGIQEVDDSLRIVDTNSGRMYITSVLRAVQHEVQQYRHVLEQAGPLLVQENVTKAAEQETLEGELSAIEGQYHEALAVLQNLPAEMRFSLESQFRAFWVERMDELTAVFEDQDMVFFRSRQSTAIYELKRALQKFTEFLPRYHRDRSYLEAKQREQEPQSSEGVEPTTLAGGGKMLMDHTSGQFVRSHTNRILQVLERERRELTIEFNTAMVHHIKDEMVLFLPQLEELLVDRRVTIVEDMLKNGATMLQHSEKRVPSRFSAAEVVEECRELKVLSFDRKSITNALRDVPEHVADMLMNMTTGPSPSEQRLALMQTWHTFSDEINPYDLVLFEDDTLENCIGSLQGMLQKSVGRYLTVLKNGIQQESSDIADNERTMDNLRIQLEGLPTFVERLESLESDLKANNVYTPDIAAMVQQQRRVAEEMGDDDRAVDVVGLKVEEP